jgi:two-component system nitrogen regulation response regulator GlnG
MSENGTARILVADDERSIRWVLSEALTADGHQVSEAATGSDALAILTRGATDVAFLDIRMPDMNGLDVVSKAREAGCQTTLVVMTAQTTMANAVEAMKRGAYDYLTKPFDLDVVRMLVQRVLETRQLSSEVNVLKGELRKRYEVGVDIIGRSAAMQNIYKLLGRVAKNDATVLIEGESGTGKELIAKAIHYHSPRWQGPFVALNCSAIPRELLESELFGFERGAFTGAIERRAGKFEQAAGGSLFLDEVADMPLELQAKLLRVLQEREFSRVGGRETLRTDVRIVAATNQELARAVRAGRFREDLYFRLNVVPIHVPPLRERKSDIPLLVQAFLHGLPGPRRAVSEAAMQRLSTHTWPGNVRELVHVLERAAVMSTSEVLDDGDFDLPADKEAGAGPGDAAPIDDDDLNLRRATDALERRLIQRALEKSGGNRAEAARLLGIGRPNLYAKMKELGLMPA